MVDDASFRPVTLRYQVGDRVSTDSFSQALGDALRGAANRGASSVIWEDHGSQMLLHLDSLEVRTVGRAIVIAIDTETTEFGRSPLIVRFVFGTGRDPATLVAASDESVHGEPMLAGRWGVLLRGVLWAAIVRLSQTHADERGQQPRSISILGDHVRFTAEPLAAFTRVRPDPLAPDPLAPDHGGPP